MLAPNPDPPATVAVESAPPISVERAGVTFAGRPALIEANWRATPGKLVAVIGPNGAGKSTLLKAIVGLVPLAAGQVSIFGAPVDAMRDRIAYVPQRASVDWDFPASALEVVTMGLTRRIGWLKPVRRRHREAARAALAAVDMAALAARPIGALSGGQQQRVFLARALVQGADILLLDEPLSGVDAATERVVLDVFRELKHQGRLVVCVHHDLSTVSENFDEAVLLGAGRVVAAGAIADVMSAANLARAYGAPMLGAVR